MAKRMRPSERFEPILEALDEMSGELGGEQAETLEEMNAELEDALLLLDEIRPGDEGWEAEYRDALEELQAQADDYRRLAGEAQGLAPIVDGLDAAIREAGAALAN